MAVQHREIAERLRAIRDLSDVSVRWLAEKVGVDEKTYASYESGDADIPVSVLYEVCSVLNISMTELLTGEPAKLTVYSHVKRGKGIDVERNAGYRYQDLAYGFAGRRVEPLLVTVDPVPDDEPLHPHAHDGHEYHYCLEGSYRVFISVKNGENSSVELRMDEGDSLYFDPKYPHAMRALGGKPAKILVIVI